MQAPLSAVARRVPITIGLSGIDEVIVCGGETITEAPEVGTLLQSTQLS